MSSELTPSDYELSRSRLGPLIRILRAADGELLDGFHRMEANPDWPEEILTQIKTPRQKLAVKIATNALRRRAPETEIANYVQNLANEIQKEGVSAADVIKEIVLDTGLKEHVVRTLLRRREGADPSSAAPVLRPPSKKTRGKAEEASLEMPETPKMPARDTNQFQEKVEETVGLLMGIPVSEIWGRLTPIFGITLKEAQGYVYRFKTSYPDIWNRHYDSRDNPVERARQPVEDEELMEEEPEYSHAEDVNLQQTTPPPPGIQYSSNELLSAALRYYPDEVINQVWDTIGLDSRKIPFMKALFYFCFNHTVKQVSLDELLSQVANDLY